ncbi:hypothetical protein ARMGADRAFT_1077991 [Armillaria gallica]|uniref:Uncharacterized protein n=1 Tax=Armillaria gallica TaxID=47427 RepID=A0A2H3DJ36_ARMGA|nr:hypothetical protein ARMGADRAFT_1077991 [Armillaria gallica]
MFPGNDMLEPRLLPRTRLQGGFVMDRDTAIKWASRIGNERRFSFVGEELDAEFMVVTQTSVFKNGYLGMDPSSIPQFKEGEREKTMRKLLEEEGLDHLEFATRLD